MCALRTRAREDVRRTAVVQSSAAPPRNPDPPSSSFHPTQPFLGSILENQKSTSPNLYLELWILFSTWRLNLGFFWLFLLFWHRWPPRAEILIEIGKIGEAWSSQAAQMQLKPGYHQAGRSNISTLKHRWLGLYWNLISKTYLIASRIQPIQNLQDQPFSQTY